MLSFYHITDIEKETSRFLSKASQWDVMKVKQLEKKQRNLLPSQEKKQILGMSLSSRLPISSPALFIGNNPEFW
ncbi:unnamed protein product [Linum trigynum]|uniref:Uncharacterized protein n=1 Tax=Linum trigynum TaxID=586398 RepID=A0AAV2GCY8_9ROSI